ncbi:SAM-dependent methyltransferase [Polynucleobacter sp. SHI8]|uniref:class I SAM-dependent methyltransferase n=1 Tax=unclassified Polynucleobacter TaxID=2640945 RepID=UPI0024919ACC|nr:MULTISPECIES: class I SAM-dependent methyltransferase [unclassified Polynucleobacter]BDW11639.1 SAM-dependent methyltransferase [Polynucleobacter sp. SHI2]BDW14086.1 SAM-dependent methyltransferase [Polynucleobacter sp. SHI8]
MAKFSKALERWNERFSTEGYLFGREVNHYLAAQKDRLHAGKALAIADGEGRNSIWLAQQGIEVEAFDFSPVALEKAKQLAQANNVSVHFQCSDWQSFAWPPNAYDYVVGIFFQFADPQERAEIFAKMDQSLRPGGLLIIQGYGEKQLDYNTGGPGVLENLYTEDLLKSAFAGYKILDSRTYEQAIEEGDGHAGMSALVGLVAQKS